MTIRFVSLLFERALLQLFQAIRTDEMLRVKFLEHGRDAATCHSIRTRYIQVTVNHVSNGASTGDGFVASGAERSSLGVIMNLAIGHPFVNEKRSTLELHIAILQINIKKTI